MGGIEARKQSRFQGRHRTERSGGWEDEIERGSNIVLFSVMVSMSLLLLLIVTKPLLLLIIIHVFIFVIRDLQSKGT